MTFNAVYKQYRNLVLQQCYEFEKNPEKLEELCQDVWLRVVEKQNQFRGESEIGTWICAVARNVALNHVRGELMSPDISFRAGSADEEWEDDDGEVFPLDHDQYLVDHSGTPEEWAQADQVADLIAKRTRMRSIEWKVLRRAVLDAFSTSEISIDLMLDESTVRVYLSRARGAIAQLLANNP